MGFLTRKELEKMGFRSLGNDVMISDKASFYSPELMSIGSNVRVDDFCILSGSIKLGNYIHISAYCGLYGKGEIEMDDFSGLSPRCTLLSGSDDFSGNYMISPMVSAEYTNVEFGKIKINKFVQIGVGTVVLPNVIIGEGTVVGAMSLVKNSIEEWGIYTGVPVRFLKNREKRLIELSIQFLKNKQKSKTK